jgi:hypothetical protein
MLLVNTVISSGRMSDLMLVPLVLLVLQQPFIFFVLVFVDSGRFAQHTTAPTIVGAAFVGESDQNLNEAAQAERRSNRESFLTVIIAFFKANPGVD